MSNKSYSRIAIVPARGGSQRLPRKNVQILGRKPLIYHTLDAVIASGEFTTVLFTSEDDELLELAGKIDGVTTEKRAYDLAGSSVKVIDVVKEIAHRSETQIYDQIGLFLPTCPFRNAKHIRDGLRMLTQDDYSVVSINEMNDPLQLALTQDSESSLIDPEGILSPSPLVTGNTRSQDFNPYYRVNGGFYIAWLDQFRERDNFFQGKVKGYIMEQLRSLDIDHQHDLDIANLLIDKGYV